MTLSEIQNFVLNHNDNELYGKTTDIVIFLEKYICFPPPQKINK